ncbi:MAG: CRISPR-associated protein Csm5 [Sulfolobus sp.]
MIEQFTITLEPISPIFVWSGERLVADADYKLVGNKLIIIDILKAMKKVSRLEDAFREEFARELYGQKLIFESKTVPQSILMINDYVVPASSLKGLIRTAILNSLIDNTVLNRVKDSFTAISSMNRREALKSVKNVAYPVEDLLKVHVQVGRGRYTYDSLNRLLIADPTVKSPHFSLSTVEIKEIAGSYSEEVYAITFDKGVLTYNAEIVKPQNYGFMSDVAQKDAIINKDKIIESLKSFSSYIINKEKDKALGKYKEFLNSLKAEDSCFPLKIGMFTGHISKTVSIPRNLENLRSQVMTRVTGHSWDNRTVKLVNGIGIGWAKVCVK